VSGLSDDSRKTLDLLLGNARAPVTLNEYVADEPLRAALDRALRALEKAKVSKVELVDAVYRAASDGFSALALDPVTPPDPDARKSPEVAVAILGDWQLGKVTPTYNSAKCEERIALYGDKVSLLTDIQRADHPVEDLHVWLLGDMIEGVTVFPGQAWQVDASLYRQITIDGPRILGNFLRKMLSRFRTVHVTAVIGNHGRLGRHGEYDPESNGDRMLYRIVQQLLAHEDRLTWTIPDGHGERHWYAIDNIGNYSCLLFHGDQFGGRMMGTLTRLGVQRKVGGWKAGAIPEPFQDVCFGHWHILEEFSVSHCLARCNGSPESYNTFAQEALAAMSPPSQRLMFVHPGHGRVTSEHKVWLS
jgi:hypothetical protein